MFRFTIRDVLWLTVVVALGVGWWVDRTHQIGRREQEVALWKSRADGLLDYLNDEYGENVGWDDSILVIYGKNDQVKRSRSNSTHEWTKPATSIGQSVGK